MFIKFQPQDLESSANKRYKWFCPNRVCLVVNQIYYYGDHPITWQQIQDSWLATSNKMPKTCWSVILKQNKKLCQCICKHGKLANNSLRYKIQNISLKSSQLLALPIFFLAEEILELTKSYEIAISLHHPCNACCLLFADP